MAPKEKLNKIQEELKAVLDKYNAEIIVSDGGEMLLYLDKSESSQFHYSNLSDQF